MASSWSNLINDLSEGIHTIKCNFGHDDEKCETCGIKCKYCDYFLEYKNIRAQMFVMYQKSSTQV